MLQKDVQTYLFYIYIYYIWLVVWNMNGLFFHIYIYIWNVILPTDEVIFFRGVGIPPTRYIYIYYHVYSIYMFIHIYIYIQYIYIYIYTV